MFFKFVKLDLDLDPDLDPDPHEMNADPQPRLIHSVLFYGTN